MDVAVNLHEHRLRLYTADPTPVAMVVYRGTALLGDYELIDQVALEIPAGDQFVSSGPRDVALEAGTYYYIGAAWPGSMIYGRSNSLPPETVSFGQVLTSVPSGDFFYPPNALGHNHSDGFPAMHQVLVTGTPPDPASSAAACASTATICCWPT